VGRLRKPIAQAGGGQGNLRGEKESGLLRGLVLGARDVFFYFAGGAMSLVKEKKGGGWEEKKGRGGNADYAEGNHVEECGPPLILPGETVESHVSRERPGRKG